MATTNPPSGDGTTSRNIQLFVKAGKDGFSPSGCPLCQRMHMILLVKSNSEGITLTVTLVNPAKPPENFRKIASRLPALIHSDDVICDPDEMVQYIDDHFPFPSLAYDNVEAVTACTDIFSKFSFYIKDVSHSSNALLAELEKLSNYLEATQHRYLCRDSLDHLDCMMLPKLQHIRVVAKVFKEFDIPPRLTGFWRYMKAAYESNVFKLTCPSDQEIVRHWMDKPECPVLSKEKKLQILPEGHSSFSFDLPSGVNV